MSAEISLQMPQRGALFHVSLLPAAFQPLFDFRYFNAVQSNCFNTAYQSNSNFVVAAPTGSGKTIVLELALLNLLSRYTDSMGNFCYRKDVKTIYVAPSRALVQERAAEWKTKYTKCLGLKVVEVSGDSTRCDLESVNTADIICTTPEKLDAISRRARETGGMGFFSQIALLLIDEVHLLNEDRGATLEAGIVSRIKIIASLPEMCQQPIGNVRFGAISATVPNIQCIAEWLGAPTHAIHSFGEEYRPSPLNIHVKGYSPAKNDYLFERRLNDHLLEVLREYSAGKPSMVFCSSRKGASDTASYVAKEALRLVVQDGRPSVFIRDPAHASRLEAACAAVRSNTLLKDCIRRGVGFHHGAVEPSDRAMVEHLFRCQDLVVLCTTSTLAVGVNLPAHLVIVKGTSRYAGKKSGNGSYEEYGSSSILQMVGRAGRPQFDEFGVAVIMTRSHYSGRYQRLAQGSEVIESHLLEFLLEFLNAEIALKTLKDVSQALMWLSSTYLYVRARKNPAHYGITTCQTVESWLKDKLLTSIKQLVSAGMISEDEDGFSLQPLTPGIIATEHYLKVKTMEHLCKVPPASAMYALLEVIARSDELSNVILKRSEKAALNAINKGNVIRHPLTDGERSNKILDRVQEPWQKCFVLLNEALSDAPTKGLEYGVRKDMENCVSSGIRISAAMIRLYSHMDRASETFNATMLQKSLNQGMWTGSPREMTQIQKITPILSQRLVTSGISSLHQLADTDPRKLEAVTQKPYPFGNAIHDALRKGGMLPAVDLTCRPTNRSAQGLIEFEVSLQCTPHRYTHSSTLSKTVHPIPARLLLGTIHDNALLVNRSLRLETISNDKDKPSYSYRFWIRSLPPNEDQGVKVVATLMHEHLVGVDVATQTLVPKGVALHSVHPISKPITPVNEESKAVNEESKVVSSSKRKASPDSPTMARNLGSLTILHSTPTSVPRAERSLRLLTPPHFNANTEMTAECPFAKFAYNGGSQATPSIETQRLASSKPEPFIIPKLSFLRGVSKQS